MVQERKLRAAEEISLIEGRCFHKDSGGSDVLSRADVAPSILAHREPEVSDCQPVPLVLHKKTTF